jgi:serine/threonine-protein kinase
MGSVYEAEQIATGKHVALKCIEGSILARGKSSVGRFQREAKAMGSIDTDHIVRVLDTGTDPGSKAPYMVMELLEGEDLQHLLDRVGRLEPDTALRIVAQVCLGLQKAHEARVVHRDIKPANLFLTRRGAGEIVVKILDFGIAKIKPDPAQGGPTTGLTRTGGVLGSPRYMSPEQARGLKEIDVHTDIWSLGMVLYGALSRKLPHEHIEAFGDLIIAICSQIPRPIQELAPWVRPDAAAVVHGALQIDAGDRFPTAAAMLDAIRPLLPDGWALRDELLVPVSTATCALIAAKLPLVHAPDDAHRRLVRIAAQGGIVDGSGTTAEAPGSARGKAGREADTTAESSVTTTTRDREATPRAKDASDPRARARWEAPVAAAVMAAAGLIAFSLTRASSHKESLQATALSTSPVDTVAVPPAPPASATSLVAPLPPFQQGKLIILPADASVEIDGMPAKVEGGAVTIEGAIGSRHQVRLVKGKNELKGEVIMTDAGVSPAMMQLDTAKPRPAAPPGARATAAPKATALPSSPNTTSSGDALIPDKFK